MRLAGGNNNMHRGFLGASRHDIWFVDINISILAAFMYHHRAAATEMASAVTRAGCSVVITGARGGGKKIVISK